jgi:guanine deaminase
MCLAAMHWARIKVFYFGCDRQDAARAGFADKDIYDAVTGRPVKGAPQARPLERRSCLEICELWKAKADRILS